MKKRIIFIEYGAQVRFLNQTKYSVMTLQSFNNLSKSDIIIYTEQPEKYEQMAVTTRSIVDKVFDYSLGGKYHFRIKPCVLLDALREHECPILFLDTDTFCNADLTKKIASINTDNVLMNIFETINPYPEFTMGSFELPSGIIYSHDPKKTKMFNSGVIGVDKGHELALKDAIFIIDKMQHNGIKRHTAEQTAISEAFRIHNIQISELHKEITHYTRGTGKDYMDDMIKKELSSLEINSPYPKNKFIKFNWFIPRLHKLSKKLKSNAKNN